MRRVLSILLLFGAAGAVSSAAAQSPQIYGAPNGLSGIDCEGIMSRLDFVAIAAGNTANDQPIIIIARLGRRETNRNLNRRRLIEVAQYLERRIPKERIITTQGARIDGLGRIEFYVGGRLNIVFTVRRNRDLVIGCGADK